MTDPIEVLSRSRALWNRTQLDLRSDETLAQIVDRGDLGDWRALFSLLSGEGEDAIRLRRRLHDLLFRVPTGNAWFWLAALESLGEKVDPDRVPRIDEGYADI
jgi:hypothetical protein